MPRATQKESSKLPNNPESIRDYIWPAFNRTDKNMYSRLSNGKDYLIRPGERIIIPKQAEFLESMYKYDAVLYGGAAGSGKTYILIWALVLILIKLAKVFQKQRESGMKNVPDVPRVVLFSSTYSMLEDRHVKEIGNYLPKWFGTMYGSKPPEFHLCDFLGGGQLLFRNLSDPDAYKSVQFAAIAFDEITENEEYVFEEIMIRKRFTGVSHIPVIAATNPTGPGRAWVHEKFVNEKTKVMPEYIEEFDYHTKGYHYIQALPTDNPTLSKAYYATLKQRKPALRDAMLYGRWDTFQGQIYNLQPSVHRFSRSMDIPDEWPKFRAIDKGVAHPTVCLWGAVDFEGDLWIYREYSVTGQDAVWHKPRIAKLSGVRFQGEDEVQVLARCPSRPEVYASTVGDPEMWRHGHTGMGDIAWREVFNDDKDEYGPFNMTRAKVSKVNEGLDDLQVGFSFDEQWEVRDDGTRKRIITRYPRIHISEDCECTWQSVTNASYDDRDPEKMKKYQGTYGPGQGDDELKALMMMWRSAVQGKLGKEGDEIDAGYEARRDGKVLERNRQPKIWLPANYKKRETSWA